MSAPFVARFPNNHLYISYSSQSTLHSCARKFEFRKLYKHPRRDSNVKAELGKALHKGYQHYLTHGDMDAAVFEFMTAYPIHMCDNPMDDSSMEAGYSTLLGIMHATPMAEYEVAKIKCLDGEVRPAIEVPFEIILEGYSLSDKERITVSYIGYIDAILYNLRERTHTVVDIKTTQWKLSDYTPVYQFSEQGIPYAFVLEYMLGKKIDQFRMNYLSCKIDVLNPNIQMYEFNKNKEDLEDWFRGLVLDLNMIKMYLNMQWWPRDGGGRSCMAFNKKCEFFDICQVRDADTIRKIIEDEITENTKLEPDEAIRSKTLKDTFEPWVRFSVEVPR